METLLDYVVAFVVRDLLKQVSFSNTTPDYKMEVSQTKDRGVTHISFPNPERKLCALLVFCPEEWCEWKCLSLPENQTPRQILSNASGATKWQYDRIKEFFTHPFPATVGLAAEGINIVIISSTLEKKDLEKILKQLIASLDKKL